MAAPPHVHGQHMDPVVTRRDLDRTGLTRSALSDALRCCLIRVRRGVYAVRPGCTASAHSDLRRIIDEESSSRLSDIDRPGVRGAAARLHFLAQSYGRSLPEDCVLSHLSAALLWALPLTRAVQTRAEAARPARSCRYRQLLVRKRSLLPDDVTRVDGIRATTVRRTLLDVALDYPLDVSVPMIDHALRAKLLTTDELSTMHASIRRRRGAARARTAFDLADPLRESPAESICAVRFHEYGIAGFVPQVSFGTNEDGFIARVDFLHRAAKVIVEVNGEIKYTDGDAGAARARRERRQDYQLRNLGYRVYQLTWADLFSPAVFHELRRAVRSLS